MEQYTCKRCHAVFVQHLISKGNSPIKLVTTTHSPKCIQCGSHNLISLPLQNFAISTN